MPGNSFGQLFQITTFGESHGNAVGVVVDGCPAGLNITVEEIQKELDRRKPGQKLTSPRFEKDQVEILSGIFEGKTTGTPLALLVRNHDAHSKSYDDIKELYRPGHADFTYDAKYGFRDWRGGGRASARETIGRVAAGAIAKKILAIAGIKIVGYVLQIGNVRATQIKESVIEKNIVRMPDPKVIDAAIEEIESARRVGDSIGGIVEVVAHNVPVGLGSPVFHKLPADLAQAFMSIPATKGFEIGDGFKVATKRGSENNDTMILKNGRMHTKTNHAGGTLGGISNGEDIVVRIALKPPSSIVKPQKTVNNKGKEATIQVRGRHDPCVCARAVPIAEAMMALTLVDHYLLNKVARL